MSIGTKRAREDTSEEASQGDLYMFMIDKEKGEYKSLTEIRGRVLLVAEQGGETKEVGQLRGSLIKRTPAVAGCFHEVCDLSDELATCSTFFFDENGKLREEGVAFFGSTKKYNQGGYLHVESVSIDSEHQGKDLGLRLLQKAMNVLKNTWSVAFILPALLEYGSFRVSNADSRIRLSKYFARLGFRQVSTKQPYCKFWAISNDRYDHNTIASKESVADLPVVLLIERKEPTAVEKKVIDIIHKFNHTASLESMLLKAQDGAPTEDNSDPFTIKVKSLIAQGLNLDDAKCLHFAVANRKLACLVPLIAMGANVNAQDEKGSTALHVAASALHPEAIRLLIALGADKSIADQNGDTALQEALGAARESDDFYRRLKMMGSHSQLESAALKDLCVLHL